MKMWLFSFNVRLFFLRVIPKTEKYIIEIYLETKPFILIQILAI